MPLVGFEPTISAGERQQTYALDRAATGTDTIQNNKNHKIQLNTNIKILRVSPQIAVFGVHCNKGTQAQIPVDGTAMPKCVGV